MNDPTPAPTPPPAEPAPPAPEGNGSSGYEWGPPFEVSAAEHKGLVTAGEARQKAIEEFNAVLLSILKAHGGDAGWSLHWVDASKRLARLRRIAKGPVPKPQYPAPRAERRALKRKLGR